MTHHFVLVLPPISPVGASAHYFWVLQKWLHEFKNETTTIIMPTYYKTAFYDQNRWEFGEWSKKFHQYAPTYLRNNDHKNIYYYPFLSEIENKSSISESFKFSVKNNCYDLFLFYKKTINEIKKSFGESLVLVSWVNNASLRDAAKKENIQLIFNEIGPLRKPYYKQTAYWDTHGVNGDTNVATLWASEKTPFKEWFTHNELHIQPETIRSLIANVSITHSTPQYPLGIALQIETDSNALVFNRGWNNLSLIEHARTRLNLDKILVRYHPNGKALYSGLTDRDPNPLVFLSNVKELWTINSSLGIEAIFWNIPVVFFGNSPVETFISLEENEKDIFYTWFFTRYLIPYDFLFSKEYYIWRLNKPSFSEIINKHLCTYREKQSEYPVLAINNENHARPLFIRPLQNTLNHLENADRNILSQKELLQKQLNSINLLECQISERDKWVNDRNTWIKDRDQWIQDRDNLIKTLQQQIVDRDRWIQDRDEIIEMYKQNIDKKPSF